MVKQSVDFQMHTELLRSVIKKQAGSADKAVLEAVMNSIDANATFVDVEVTPQTIHITDDGKGFASAQEIQDFFATFGTPHKEGDATYGRFRMGRGQMFAFGKNTWRTGEFRMEVDVDVKLGFDLEKGLEPHKGCDIHIVLYDTLSQYEVYATTTTLKKMVKYVSIPVKVNGVMVASPPDPKKFPESTDDAFIKVTNDSYGSLDVYNLGVFVESHSTYKYGVSGVVVSKRQLDVNFARNQVLASCQVWKKVKPVIDNNGKQKVERKAELSSDEQINVAHRLISGETIKALGNVRFIKDTTGKAWSLAMIKRKGFTAYSVAPTHNAKADKLMQSNTAFIVAQEFVDVCGVKPECFFSALGSTVMGHGTALLDYVPFQELASEVAMSFKRLSDKALTPTERAWVAVLSRAMDIMSNYGASYEWVGGTGKWGDDDYSPGNSVRTNGFGNNRAVHVGMASNAEAWTDGCSYVCFDKQFLANNPLMEHGAPCVASVTRALAVLAHELCHDNDSRELGHTPDFYREYHDFTSGMGFSNAVSLVCKYVTPARWQKWMKEGRKGAVVDAQPEAILCKGLDVGSE